MEQIGKIIAVLGERSGTSARTGTEWKVATYVLETFGDYPRKMCFDVFGAERIQSCNIQAGEMLRVRFDIDAHEYNGRWYNTIRAFSVDRNLDTTAPAPASAVPGGAPFSGAPAPPADEDSELPF